MPEDCIMRRFISAFAIATLCASGAAFAQDSAKTETKKAGEATKEAGKGHCGCRQAHRQGRGEGDKEGRQGDRKRDQGRRSAHLYLCRRHHRRSRH
jgi:hypothetical protein